MIIFMSTLYLMIIFDVQPSTRIQSSSRDSSPLSQNSLTWSSHLHLGGAKFVEIPLQELDVMDFDFNDAIDLVDVSMNHFNPYPDPSAADWS